jgi:hypothetical protein
MVFISTMHEANPPPPNRYVLVSSLYGPGSIACWYFTILSILVSWTLHPKKRKSGSIDVDLIAILTLPAVAAGHLIVQVSRLVNDHDIIPESDVDEDQYAQSIAAIEAPFTVIETFMAISVVLFLVSVWKSCFRRAISVALIGLLCLATECYVHFSTLNDLDLRYEPSRLQREGRPAFDRSFVADFTGLIVSIPVILTVCAATASAIVAIMLRAQRARHLAFEGEQRRLAEIVEASSRAGASPSRTSGRPNAQGMDSRRAQGVERRRSRDWVREYQEAKRIHRASGFVTLIFLPSTFLLTILPGAVNAVQMSLAMFTPRSRSTPFWSRLKIFASHFYPRSADSFSELDQAVATAAGATILAFSIYSVAKARYEIKRVDAERSTRANGGGIELNRLRRYQVV